MNRAIVIMMFAAIGLSATGCGDGKFFAKGRLLKSGKPCSLPDGEYYHVTFVPVLPDGKPAGDYYYCTVNQADGTFRSVGKDLRGVPPGKYRVAVEHFKNKKDLLGGRYDFDRTPYVFDVDGSTSEIVIDIDQPPKK
jgi:hypothetical protein